MTTQANLETDVLVVGGGPSGLATAIAVRQAGLDVIVADCDSPPIDKACGEGIMPDGLAALKRLGINLDASQNGIFRGIRFVNGHSQIEARFPQGIGIGVRRTVLHQMLVDAAVSAGARLLWKRRLIGMTPGRALLERETVGCRWIIGADGQKSRTRQLADLNQGGNFKQRIGLRRHYRVKSWSEFVEVHWSNAGQMYVTPIGEDEICIAFISKHKTARWEEALLHFPELGRRLRDAAPEGSPRGGFTASRRLATVVRGHVALVGDAAGSVDAITGQGMAIGFQQATDLAKALVCGNLTAYDQAVRRIMRLPRAMATMMLSMDDHPAFRLRVFAAFEARPEMFERMLAIHTAAKSPVSIGLRSGLSFGWQLLAAKGQSA